MLIRAREFFDWYHNAEKVLKDVYEKGRHSDEGIFSKGISNEEQDRMVRDGANRYLVIGCLVSLRFLKREIKILGGGDNPLLRVPKNFKYHVEMQDCRDSLDRINSMVERFSLGVVA